MTPLQQLYRTSIDGYIAKHKLSCGSQRHFADIERSRVKRCVFTQIRRFSPISDNEGA